jgi:hypothetical protein
MASTKVVARPATLRIQTREVVGAGAVGVVSVAVDRMSVAAMMLVVMASS